MKSAVAMLQCRDYSGALVEDAVRRACDLAGFPEVSGKTVLLKPNILKAAAPDEAVTTHPEVLRAVIRYAKSHGASRILVGDSPGFQLGAAAFRKSGLIQVTEAEGAEWSDFSEGVEVANPQGRLVKSFTLARAAVEADVLVSLPKLKNHTLMYFTGAMKNLFGCIPGLQKPPFHLRFPDRRRFGEMLVDLNIALRCDFALMDGIVGMEGPGPGAGYPRRVGAILASRDPLALDRSACAVIGLDPDLVVNLAEGLTRGLWIGSDAEIEYPAQRPQAFFVPDWKHVPREERRLGRMPAPLRNLFVGRPFFSRRKCIACGGCVEICPGNALSLQSVPGTRTGRAVRVDYKACIRCYCCHEVCPADAIRVSRLRPLGFV
ncbi:MAG TPA: DUF362 domain-containing protein [Rectinemataceae bacterium]|nr:DUF362 domain-containing protein [Rectinemataceae bacterium]